MTIKKKPKWKRHSFAFPVPVFPNEARALDGCDMVFSFSGPDELRVTGFSIESRDDLVEEVRMTATQMRMHRFPSG